MKKLERFEKTCATVYIEANDFHHQQSACIRELKKKQTSMHPMKGKCQERSLNVQNAPYQRVIDANGNMATATSFRISAVLLREF